MRERLLEAIEKHWGYSSFRPLQEEAMSAVLGDHDSLVVMPTGGGKSLCYQVPALLRDGVTVVVSPLISLMKDQVDALIACGVSAAQMNSSQSSVELRALDKDLHDGKIRLLFVSPERLALPGFRKSLRQARVAAFAIDEAHCISHWGHDFRPEYRQLRTLREEFPNAGFHAYTATATEQVRRDIAQQLALRDPAVLVGDFDRPNLTYRVLPRVDELKQLVEVLERHRGEAGIVYCIRRRDVDGLSEQLRKRGYDALAYHAGLSQEERRTTQEAFAAERCDVVVATVAFGMGIDRSNVRFVVHMAMPKSIEHYQQETGRAGRDGLEAECVLFYSGADIVLWKTMLSRGGEEMEPDPRYVQAASRHLNDMDRYCSGTICRHRALVEYFGQSCSSSSCNACDVCLGEMQDVAEPLTVAQKIVSCVYRLRSSFGVGHVISVLRGENIERIRDRQHDQLSTYGIMREHSRNELRDLVYQLVNQGFLQQAGDEYPVLQLTETSRAVLRGDAQIRLRQPVVPKKKEGVRQRRTLADDAAVYDRALFESLRKWRRGEAERRQVPPYVIFSDRTLREVARLQPVNLTQLRGIYGIGDAKMEQFGEAIVTRVREHASTAP
ncbi:MAG TPA: DNA helicase RecQ [Thermoanaerobaculia bacterium]|nr:DNA helicase RecQ [Thermoanaerobaculia bacterium]